jgi:hypothetical protein
MWSSDELRRRASGRSVAANFLFSSRATSRSSPSSRISASSGTGFRPPKRVTARRSLSCIAAVIVNCILLRSAAIGVTAKGLTTPCSGAGATWRTFPPASGGAASVIGWAIGSIVVGTGACGKRSASSSRSSLRGLNDTSASNSAAFSAVR